MKKIILIFLSVMLLLTTVAYSKDDVSFKTWNDTFGTTESTRTILADSSHLVFISPYEAAIQKEALFHINDVATRDEIYTSHTINSVHNLVPIIKLDFYYIFNKRGSKKLGHLGSFSYSSILYKNKNHVGVKVSTTILKRPYH